MLKKYSTIFIIAICLLFTIHVSAQVPGYRGKRLNVTYDFNFYHNLFKYTHIGEYFGDSYSSSSESTWTAPRPTIKNGIGLEYVLGRHSSVIANTSVFFSKIETKDVFSYTNTASWFGFSNDETVYAEPVDETKMFAYNLGIHYRAYYKNKGLAPLGNFFDIGIERIAYKLTVSDQMSISDYYDYYYNSYYSSSTVSSSSIPYTLKKWNSVYLLNAGFGTQRVLYKNLTCRYGVKLGWELGGLLNIFNNEYGNHLTEQNYFEYTAKNHLLNKNLLQLDFGIGYLIK